MQMTTLHDLMVHELKDLYSAERQLVQALPKMAQSASNSELQVAIATHLEQTKEHVARLEQAFEMLGESGKGMKCKGMEGLIEEGKSLLEEDIDPDVLDAGIIAAAQRVEHYEIAAYGTVREYARTLGHDEIAALLTATLDEEKSADQLLSGLAEGGINALAERDGQQGATQEGVKGPAASPRTSGAAQRSKTGAKRR
ncbi:MAG: ferritin-like domain-containing protein [Cytophagaceae bacterium]|nr:ferritin-like domain-containing protein [Gemmatimonadaceae bacterium]